jgi:hypothetical protein
MAGAAFVAGGIIADDPHWKCFLINSPENDAINRDDTLTFAAGGMGPMVCAPHVYWAQDVTDFASAPTVVHNISIHHVTNLQFHIGTTSVAGGGGAKARTFRVYMLAKLAGEI